jgi:D-3-phosphoglycerate dehydrogenase/C-terminal binding protein
MPQERLMAQQKKTFRVVITDYIRDDLAIERAELGDVATIEALDAYSEAELAGRIDEADALLVFHNVALTHVSIERLQCCRVIARVGVGYDNVDTVAARAKHIDVTNVPDYGTEEVADSAIGMMLALTRGITRMDLRLRTASGIWDYQHGAPLHRLRGRVLGIVGLGRIGKATALRGKALGMDVAYYDPLIEDGYDKALGIRRAEQLEELCRQSYVLSLHCPRTPVTHRMIDARAIAWLPPGSYLVNTARGGIVDTAALPAALESGHLAGVALDVLPTEPPPPDDRLLAIWRDPSHPCYGRILINPHAAFYCEEGLREMRQKAAASCRRALLGLPQRNIVN